LERIFTEATRKTVNEMEVIISDDRGMGLFM